MGQKTTAVSEKLDKIFGGDDLSSDLKRLSNLFIIFTIISCIFSFFILRPYLIYRLELKGMGLFFIYLAIVPPILFVSAAIIIRRIAEQISIVDNHLKQRLKEVGEEIFIIDKHLRDRIRELEEQLQQQINE